MPLVAWEEVDGRIRSAEQSDGDIASGSIATWCINTEETAFIKRGIDDPRESARVHQARSEMRLGSTVCVPLVHENKPWGVLYAHRRLDQHDFNDNDINLFKIIGSQTSIALHRHDLLQRVRHQAYHDSLTGLPNRLHFETLLNDALKPVAGKKPQVAVMFLDLDGFKAVNDSYGHAVGDDILKKVAQRLKSSLKCGDVLARMGGDEFSVIIRDLSLIHI